jgi:hypothetical protein
MKHLALLLASSMLLATAMPAFAAGSNDTDSLSPKNTPNTPNTASSAPDDESSSEEAAPPENSNPPAAGEISARDPQSVMDALKTLGYPGKLEKMDSGRTSIAVQVSGLKTYIDFYDCADDLTDCYTLLFNVSLDLKKGTTLDKANEWNSKQITGRVWLDDNKDPTLDYSFSTFNGVSEDTFDQNVKLWDKKIGDLKDFFDF